MTHSIEDERLERLRSVPLFAELGDKSLRLILERSTEFEVSQGHVLVETNQPATGLFVIEEGSVTVETRHRQIDLGPGEFFGELAVLDEKATRSARVHAAERLRCLAIHRDHFRELLESEPKIAMSMLRVLAKRLADEARS